MLDGLKLDPYTILGVTPDASLEEIREAYRLKSKKHHPDLGGDEWAFRIVARAYELIGRPGHGARNGQGPGSADEVIRAPSSPRFADFTHFPDPEADIDPGPVRDWAAESERVRPGVQDRDFEAGHMVLVEVLWLRMEVEDIYALLDRREGSHFSGSLHLLWPDPDATLEHPLDPAQTQAILRELSDTFNALRARSDVINARSTADRGRFEAWLSYPSGQKAWSAFKALRPDLNGRGLGVRQVTRDLTIPRQNNTP